MEIKCQAESVFPAIEKLIKKISDSTKLNPEEDKKLRDLLDEYWNIDCPFDGKYCVPPKCSYAKPENWVEYHGYTSMADLLHDFEYEKVEILELKDKRSIDTMDAHWGRRGGHYNP